MQLRICLSIAQCFVFFCARVVSLLGLSYMLDNTLRFDCNVSTGQNTFVYREMINSSGYARRITVYIKIYDRYRHLLWCTDNVHEAIENVLVAMKTIRTSIRFMKNVPFHFSFFFAIIKHNNNDINNNNNIHILC